MVLKGVGGFYSVALLDKPEQPVTQCVIRGKMKQGGPDRPVVAGDEVLVQIGEDGQGVVTQALPRRIVLTRPVVANVDRVVVVMAATSPEPDLSLLDRLLVQVERLDLEAVICFNKCDLVTEYRLHKLSGPYRKIGYTVLNTSAVEGRNIPRLRSLLAGRVATLAGPSGVGKSALVNALKGVQTHHEGEISVKTQRGKHTTREVELLPLANGGFLADTPGFSSLNFKDITPQETARCFPEFAEAAEDCRFATCMHDREPDCGVKEAVKDGRIPEHRYQHYLDLLAEARQNSRW